MDVTRIGQGQRIAAVGGLALFVFLFLPWFGGGRESLSGWEGQSSTDIYLLITAVVAIGAAGAAGGAVVPGLTMNGAAALLGGVGTLLLLWLTIFDFPEGADREIGLYLSLIACATIALGGYMAAQGDVESARAPRS